MRTERLSTHAFGPTPEEALGGAHRGDIRVRCVLELAVLQCPLSGTKPDSHWQCSRHRVRAGLTVQLLRLLVPEPGRVEDRPDPGVGDLLKSWLTLLS